MQLDQVIAALQRIKGSKGWKTLSARSGVDYFTIARIARGEIKNPGILTVEKIVAALPAAARAPRKLVPVEKAKAHA